MLKSLEFENFKSWAGRHGLDFGHTTGLFGANSSGKSSIIHLLLLLKQTAESADSELVLNFGGSTREYVDFGSYKDAVNSHDLSRPISYSITWTPEYRRRSRSYLSSISNLTLSGKLKALRRRYGEEVVVDRLQYDIVMRRPIGRHNRTRSVPKSTDSISLAAARGPSGGYTLKATIVSDGQIDNLTFGRALREYQPTGLYRLSPRAHYQIGKRLREEYRSSRLFGRTPIAAYRLQDSIRQVEELTTQLLRNHIIYLGPLREYPYRNYSWTGATPATIGTRGEEAIQVLLAGASQKTSKGISDNTLSDRSATIDAVTYWLQELKIAQSISFQQVGRGARIWEARLHQERESDDTGINLTDVGFGVSQVLPVIVALLSAPRGSLVILEHPEIHLHPRIQSELADLLVEIGNTGEIQILVESHSEHLLARIQRRIAESSRGDGSLAPEDVRLYFCEQEQGKSKLTPLDMQASGVITNWPRDFFGDMLAERMALGGFYPDAEEQTSDG